MALQIPYAALAAFTTVSIALHVAAGSVALGAGVVAAIAGKGGAVHRSAGNIFCAAMLVMAVFAGCLAVLVPGQIVNLFISIFTAYLVVTAWMTVRRGEKAGLPEWLALGVGIVLCAPFLLLSFELLTGAKPFFETAIAFKGPILVAIYSFTAILGIAAMGDVRMVFVGGLSATARIVRHLWRMCIALTLASGSAFTNGLSRLLPGPHHVPAAFFFPQFVPLGLLLFWLVRILLIGGWRPVRLAKAA